MAYQVYVTVTGTKQGVFKGESTQKGREGKIQALAVSYGVTVPRDIASGQASGKRTEQPLVFSKNWGASSPQFFAAAYANEALSSVLIEYYAQSADGSVKVDHTVKLTNASIVSVLDSFAETNATGAADGRDIDTITLTFQKIEITSNSGGTSAIDELRANV